MQETAAAKSESAEAVHVCENTKCSDRHLLNEFCNKHWYLASIFRVLKHVDN